MPAQDGVAVFKFDGEPDVTAVDGVFGAPAVAHVNEAGGGGQDVGGLAVEGGGDLLG